MGAGHSAEAGEGGACVSDPPADVRHQRHHKRRRHSVDSVASYSSQNHVDRIRTQNFSASSCQDEGELPPLKHNNFKRSISNLDISFSRRPDSANSNGSSTRSRLREFVERKSQDDNKATVNKTGEIEYFDNPTETLEFDRQRSTLTGKKSHDEHKKKKRTKEEKARDLREGKPKKHEKYQSKLAEYYNLPPQLPQDEFYHHLTRSKATNEELLQRRFASNCSDAEFNGSYGKLCKHKEVEGSNLRRSRSLAVIREETFTDLQIQNNNKSKRSQLIPRARLFDKPCFKDRLPGRAKYQTKEEALESIYIKTTTSCFGDINDQLEPKNHIASPAQDDKSNKEDTHSQRESYCSKSIEGSWPNLAENISKLYPQLSEDSINYSRNPSEIDSLDSNYVRKHYNFEAHHNGNCKESSPETDRSHSPTEPPRKTIFIRPEVKEHIEAVDKKDLVLPTYFRNPKYDSTERSFSHDSVSASNSEKSQTELNVLDVSHDIDSYEEVPLEDKQSEDKCKINTQTITKSTSLRNNIDTISITSENDGTISTPPDSITSYVSISIPSSTEKTRKLEYLANSLAEKIDEYCDQRDSYSEVPITEKDSFQIDNEVNPIYTRVHKIKHIKELGGDPLYCKPSDIQNQINHAYKNGNHISNVYLDSNDLRSKALNQQESSSKNITTEPFVTTLIENQYYSLPDINISKSLRKSERIDAKLREEDPEEIYCENTYEVANSTYNSVSSTKGTVNYGQLNNTYKIDKSHADISASEELDIFFKQNVDSCKLQNCSRFEDDIKSIITDSSVYEESHFVVDTHQNEKEVNEIEGTIRANKLIVKSDPNNSNSTLTPNFIVGKTDRKLSTCSLIDYCQQNKKNNQVYRTGIRKHYSLRQREPDNEHINSLPNPETLLDFPNREINKAFQDSNTTKSNTLLSRVKPFKSSTESSIEIVPLSGHQTIIIDPPISQNQSNDTGLIKYTPKEKPNPSFIENTQKEQKNLNIVSGQERPNKLLGLTSEVDKTHYCTPKEAFITIKLNKVVKATVPRLRKETSDKIAVAQIKFEKPPARLIIKDKKGNSEPLPKSSATMTRPQVLQIVDSKKEKQDNTGNISSVPSDQFETAKTHVKRNKEESKDTKVDIQHCNSVSDKINDAIKTDLEYQEKLHSVKNYWSKLIEKPNLVMPETKIKDTENRESITESVLENEEFSLSPEVTVSDIVKSIETVKIVDSIRKSNPVKLENWKEETEKLKDDSEIDETAVNKPIQEDVCNDSIDKLEHPINSNKSKANSIARDTPEIEIVELSSDDNKNKVTQATLIKAKSYEKGCEEFDHVRYKVMKSELFKNSMIANYRKEAQFDGLLQYLQDYSFQELLVNNNVVIIEPVRTKVEQVAHKISTSRISPSLLKKNDNVGNIIEKSKNAIKRHFFYHPIRVNKEIIEDELPNPDTVKKFRNLFEDTLKMKSPINQSDPAILDEPVILSKRSTSYRNIIDEPKNTQNVCRKKTMRNLAIDTSYGNRKWDSASLSSGVSSGDLSSNNEYETDRMSPYSIKHIRDNVYSSSSEEYLCDSLNPNICYESQYVSQDILKKIRDCGTSITYYGGKVLNSKTGPVISPMTKAIMEEIRGLQKLCSRDCYSCQTKCHGSKCSCVVADTHKNSQDENKLHSSTSSDSGNQDPHKPRENKLNNGFPGFKFKLVKSNSCSSRLELTGTDDSKNPRLRYRNKLRSSMDDPPLIYDEENSVKNKVCRLESYKKGMVDTPFDQNRENNYFSDKTKKLEGIEGEQASPKSESGVKDKSGRVITKTNREILKDDKFENNEEDKSDSDPHKFERKYYYVNDKIEQNKGTSTKKFGEMVFEEFEVLESCYDSLSSAKSISK